ncbi:putative permease [Salmonella enterica subsp. arizonae]|uniref:Putative permease n=1 Tax=Salmonella enterica subsp. arizonae TaxID=59203 RepID=A0A379SG32_SALER|nr:putative permease [Salmonella enterica subsp. arizonae]SUH95474.1 putative permease [Salmonella enterica subsp. arizonae]
MQLWTATFQQTWCFLYWGLACLKWRSLSCRSVCFSDYLRPKGNARPSVVVADSGQLSRHKDGSQIVTLNKGTRFEGTATQRDFRITDFNNYQATIGCRAVSADLNDTEQMDMRTFWNTDSKRARAELHWRITLVITVFIMALLVVPLSVVNPRQGRVLSMLPAMLLYLVFFLLQTTLKSSSGKGRLDPAVWMWGVNLLYIALAAGLNLWDTAYPSPYFH